MKLFTDHFEMFGALVPSYITLDERFRKYLELTIGKRKPISEAVALIEDPVFSIKSFREKVISEQMAKLLRKNKVTVRTWALMVLEFDRWNNYRILPADIQEPSAFKRRNKKNEIRNLRNVADLNGFTIRRIKLKYEIKGEAPRKVLFVPVVEEQGKSGSIIKVENNKTTVEGLSKIGFYLFPKEKHAQEFLNHILLYKLNDRKDCKQGQRFWPKFRLLTQNSMNYNFIQKRVASRKFLETALRDLDAGYLKKELADIEKSLYGDIL